MKRLYILRHSKAGQTNKQVLKDYERKLTDKGVEMCAHVGAYFKLSTLPPQLMLCSQADRTLETAKYSMKAANMDIPLQISPRLYLADPEIILAEIQAVNDDIESLALVAHNPGVQQFCIDLAGSGDKKLFREMRQNFPPPSIAVFDIHVASWGLVVPRSGVLIDFKDPTGLKKVGQ